VQRGEDGQAAVWVVRQGKVQRVPVTAGEFGNEQVQVSGKLAASDWVVAAGGHLLAEGEEVVPVDRENRPVQAAAAPTGGN
jgi:multidrug efflux system membrane fusion protein